MVVARRHQWHLLTGRFVPEPWHRDELRVTKLRVTHDGPLAT
jgi:hypothetical protein